MAEISTRLPRALRPFGRGQYRLLAVALAPRCSAPGDGSSRPGGRSSNSATADGALPRRPRQQHWPRARRAARRRRSRSHPSATHPSRVRGDPLRRLRNGGRACVDRRHPSVAARRDLRVARAHAGLDGPRRAHGRGDRHRPDLRVRRERAHPARRRHPRAGAPGLRRARSPPGRRRAGCRSRHGSHGRGGPGPPVEEPRG